LIVLSNYLSSNLPIYPTIVPTMGDSTESVAKAADLPKSTTSISNGEKSVPMGHEPQDSASASEGEPGRDVEDTSEYLPTWKMAIVTFALCLGVFCTSLVCPFPDTGFVKTTRLIIM
jgi:hypothetical protein